MQTSTNTYTLWTSEEVCEVYHDPDRTHPAQLVLSDGAGVHESLGDDGKHGVHVVGSLDVKNKLRILDDVDPKAQWQTEDTEEYNSV